MRKRTQASANVNTLLDTICKRDRPPDEVVFHNLCSDAESVAGSVRVAHAAKLHQLNEDKFISCWAELRGDTIVFSETNAKTDKRVSLAPMRVTFCSKVEPPPKAAISSQTNKMIANKIASKCNVAVYGYGKRPCLWFNFEDSNEARRWEQVRAGPHDRGPCPRSDVCVPS